MDNSGHQPEKPALPELFLNSGGFQLRLFRQRIGYGQPFTGTCLTGDIVPCASLLVRILPATRTADRPQRLTVTELADPVQQGILGMLYTDYVISASLAQLSVVCDIHIVFRACDPSTFIR